MSSLGTPTPSLQALESGRQLGKPNEAGRLWTNQGRFRVTRIVKNEERKRGVDEFRVLMLTYQADWNTQYKALSEELNGKGLSRERKAIVLLRYDHFASKWERSAQDTASADEAFSTSNVDKALRQEETSLSGMARSVR